MSAQPLLTLLIPTADASHATYLDTGTQLLALVLPAQLDSTSMRPHLHVFALQPHHILELTMYVLPVTLLITGTQQPELVYLAQSILIGILQH